MAWLKQECPVPFVYGTWILYPVGFAYLAVRGEWVAAVVWLVAYPFALWGYVRAFPRLSRFFGYGSVADELPDEVERPPQPTVVTLYTAAGCPFCPIVERRLERLRAAMGFTLEKVDVTLKPDVLKAKGIRSVPVVEVGERRHVGHATSRELARLIRGEGA